VVGDRDLVVGQMTGRDEAVIKLLQSNMKIMLKITNKSNR
jgi:hypothetical protein